MKGFYMSIPRARVAGILFCMMLSLYAYAGSAERLDVKKMGAKGDGISDDTRFLQWAFNVASSGKIKTVYIPAGIYKTKPLFLRSGISVVFNKNAILSAMSGYGPTDCVLKGENIQDVTIWGHGAKIYMPKQEYTKGEWQMGVSIVSCSKVRIENLTVRDAGGDGFYIGTSFETRVCPDSIILRNCRSINARRNALSIINGKNILIDGGLYDYANGTLPNCGIDLEPNYPYEQLTNIVIRNVTTSRNPGSGIAIQPFNLVTPEMDTLFVSITVENYTSVDDGSRSGAAAIAFYFTEEQFRENLVIAGNITIGKTILKNPWGKKIVFTRWPKASCHSIAE